MDIGPRPLPTEWSCKGCPALKVEYWKEHLENDETDSGEKATCTASGQDITAYWHERYPVPKWCPAKLPQLTTTERAAMDSFPPDFIQQLLKEKS